MPETKATQRSGRAESPKPAPQKEDDSKEKKVAKKE
jgi:hypothetical protein